jgi:hypothetical protein
VKHSGAVMPLNKSRSFAGAQDDTREALWITTKNNEDDNLEGINDAPEAFD